MHIYTFVHIYIDVKRVHIPGNISGSNAMHICRRMRPWRYLDHIRTLLQMQSSNLAQCGLDVRNNQALETGTRAFRYSKRIVTYVGALRLEVPESARTRARFVGYED